MSVAWVLEEDPRTLASQLVEVSRDRPEWLAALARELESQVLVDQLRRFLEVWGLSGSAAARLFGVSRQALSKWLAQGVPADRLETVANLAAATDLLVRYLKIGRVPATVRRKADRLKGSSLLDLVAAGDSRGALQACRAMFDFSGVNA
jgi:transcriptional regulator with XRE-family HTH domain